MFMGCFSNVFAPCVPELTDEFYSDLACLLKSSVAAYSTCQYPGDSYYHVIMLATAASIEYQQIYKIAVDSMYAAIANGKSATMPNIDRYFGIYGQLLKRFESENPLTPSVTFG
jgi:hypothetical protein